MSLGNGNGKTGNKRSNHGIDHRTLLLLGQLSTTLGSGGATESTLQAVLAALNAGSEFEAKLVEDNVGVTWLEVRTYDIVSGTLNPPVYYLAGSPTTGSPALPISYLNFGSLLTTIATETTGINSKLTGVTRTPSLTRVLGAASSSIAAGARSVSFFNAGPTAAIVAGGALNSGEVINFAAGGEEDTLGTIAYVTIATGDLAITTVV